VKVGGQHDDGVSQDVGSVSRGKHGFTDKTIETRWK